MSTHLQTLHRLTMALALGGAFTMAHPAVAQQKSVTLPDAQVASNVLQALASNPKLSDQTISTTAISGEVTLTGSVRDEATRTLAEQVVARTTGVTKVVDELTVGGDNPAAPSAPAMVEQGTPSGTGAQPTGEEAQAASNPNLQSDGTMAPPDVQQGQSATSGNPSQSAGLPPVPPSNQPYGQAGPPMGSGGYGGARSDGQNGSPTSYPPPRPYGPPPYPTSNGQYTQGAVAPYGGSRPRPSQTGGQAVVVPAGTVLRVRTNQEIDSRHSPAGSSFNGVMLSDVIADGAIAIPRGAQVQGVVSEAKSAGAVKGRAELSLQLTSITLGGNVYPLVSDAWDHAGPDKTGRTVGSAVGLGVVGAILGGVAGGGPGAAIGAAAGGAVGVGASAASPSGQIYVPAEAVLSFRLTQPAPLTTVSQAELNRLGAGLPYPQRRGVGQPPPPPYAYGPPAYPYAYPRYYYRPYPY